MCWVRKKCARVSFYIFVTRILQDNLTVRARTSQTKFSMHATWVTWQLFCLKQDMCEMPVFRETGSKDGLLCCKPERCRNFLKILSDSMQLLQKNSEPCFLNKGDARAKILGSNTWKNICRFTMVILTSFIYTIYNGKLCVYTKTQQTVLWSVQNIFNVLSVT